MRFLALRPLRQMFLAQVAALSGPKLATLVQRRWRTAEMTAQPHSHDDLPAYIRICGALTGPLSMT